MVGLDASEAVPVSSVEHTNNTVIDDSDSGDTGESESDEFALMVTSNSSTHQSHDWYIDSAATSHMTFNRNILVDYVEFEKPKEVSLGDNHNISALGTGKVRLPFIDENGCTKNLSSDRVMYIPEIAKNLLSVPSMTSNKAMVMFDDEKCLV